MTKELGASKLELAKLRKNSDTMKLKLVDLQNNQKVLSVDNVKDKPSLFRYFTGLEDYKTFKIIFTSFGSVVNKLIYHDSNNSVEKLSSDDYVKRGPKRKLSSEQEFFFVLVRLSLGLLEGDIAMRAGIQCHIFPEYGLHG